MARRTAAAGLTGLVLAAALVLLTVPPGGEASAPARPRAAAAPRVAIVIAGVADVAAFEATLRYDPAVVSPTNVALGPFPPAGSEMLGPDLSQPGVVVVGSYAARGETASGGGVLAEVAFARLAPGDPAWRLDPDATGAFDRTGNPLDATIGLREGGAMVFVPAGYR